MKQQLNEIKKMQRIAGIITESEYQDSQINEEQYAEPIVMIQNIVNHWFDGGIKAEAALIRIEKILQGNYEDESGEGFDKTKIIKNAITIELYQGTTLVGPKENEAAARELAKKIEAEMKNAYKGAKGSGSESDAMDARDEAVYDFEDELSELGFEIE